MALVIEDGSIVAGAQSYVTEGDYKAYAKARGFTVGGSASEREAELIKAMDYLEGLRDRYKGVKTLKTQSLQWPRYNVYIDGYQADSDSIPSELKNAQMELARLSREFDLSPSQSTQNIQSEKLGELQVSYFSGGSYQSNQLKSVEQFLGELLKGSGQFSSVRV